MKRHYAYITFLLALFLLASIPSGFVQAKTPDGETPANEGVCDVLKAEGITPGLYGLCVAYCEALDCDEDIASLSPEEIVTECRPASPVILEKYNALKKDTDPDMPCVQEGSCPCWSSEEISAIGMNWSPQSIYASMWDFSTYTSYSLTEYRTVTSTFPYGAYNGATIRFWKESQIQECIYTYYDADPENPAYIVRYQQITENEATAGTSQILEQYQYLHNIKDEDVIDCGGNLDLCQ